MLVVLVVALLVVVLQALLAKVFHCGAGTAVHLLDDSMLPVT